MTWIVFLAVAYAAGAGLLLALSPVWARDLQVPVEDVRSSIWHAVIAAPLLFMGLVAWLVLLASA